MKITYTGSVLKRESETILHVAFGDKKYDEVHIENGIRTLVLGIPNMREVTHRTYPLIIRRMVRKAHEYKAKKIVCVFSDFIFSHLSLTEAEIGEIFARNTLMADYSFDLYKTVSKDFHHIDEIVIAGVVNTEIKKAFEKGMIQAEEINKMRDLANTPGGDMTPTILADKIKSSLKKLPIKITVLGEKEMKAKKMEAILSVGRGSKEESKFIILEYKGGSSKEAPIVLVGKGVTFDTGGINLKPSNGLLGMNMDMSGGAAVAHTIALAARLKLKKNLVGLIPSVENMNSGESYRPGDVVRSMSGYTIEVLDTDAEGRVILADALWYAKKWNPALVVDVATLTGAACVALGERASALFSKDQVLIEKFMHAAERANDHAWPLPLWDEYEADIKGTIGDFTNMHNKSSRYGGAITAAIFLYQFIKGTPWVHIDMAPRMTAVHDEFLAGGASGSPIALMYNFLENYKF